VADNQPYSFEELESRKLRVHHALEAAGFRFVATAVNIVGGGRIPASVTREAGLPESAAAILTAVPQDLRSSVDLVVRGDPVAQDFSAFGGMWVREGTQSKCTSGWSVRAVDDGTSGVTTAGHCEQIDHIVHPQHGVHTLTFRSQHRGQWGDVEWHTSGEPEPDDFYSDASTVRDVIGVQPRASISVGEFVCVYGRSSMSGTARWTCKMCHRRAPSPAGSTIASS
jgi:hypothetical protein